MITGAEDHTHIAKRIDEEMRGEVTSGSRIGVCPAGPIVGRVVARDVCEDCAGTGWDSSDQQIWCPSCEGTGKAEDVYVVAADPHRKLTSERPVSTR